MRDKKTINFWNGNKSSARQDYELALLQMLLNLSSLQKINIVNDTTDYPKAEDESNVFDHTDILVTVAGNKKFHKKSFIKVDKPLCKGLLGQRVLIIRQQDQAQFNNITPRDLKEKVAGIPATWVDADLFRSNDYNVLEQGSLCDMFQMLKQGKCDYISLGANEVQGVFDELGTVGELAIETSLLLYYPFPLIFYIHPAKKELAKNIESALQQAQQTDFLDQLFNQHYGDVMSALNIKKRHLLILKNPNVPENLQLPIFC
jgi:ABC-type amino acid transport substrate-binding protein